MTNQNNTALAAEQNPLSDEYVNAVIQRHGYDSPECVIARLHQWIGLHGGENGVTLLMYEAHKALVKLRAPVADERAAEHMARKVELLEQVAHYADLCCAFLRDGGYAGKADALASRIKAVIDLDGQISSPVADERATESHFEDELERAYWEMDARIKGLGQHKGRPQPDRDAFKWAVRGMRPMPPKSAPERICICCNVPRNNCDCEPVSAALASAPVAGEALGWRVRERRSNDGKLLDCFVEAPAVPGMAYAQEVLGDDYAEAQGGIEGKLKHCQMIVAWANATPQASEAVRVLGIDLGADGIADVRNATLEEISQVLKNGIFVSVEDAADYILTRRTKAAPQLSETDAAAFSTAVDYRRMEDTQIGASERLAKLAAALGNRDWKWWDSCSFRRLTFEDGPDRRDGGALCGWVQPSDGHPDVSMAPGVREFIEAASPKAIAALAAAYMAALPAQPEQP